MGPSKYNERGSGTARDVVIGSLLSVLFGVIFLLVGPRQGAHSATITVCSVEKYKNGSHHEYRVYTSDGTYKMANSWTVVKRRDTENAYEVLEREVATGPVTFQVIVKDDWRHKLASHANILTFNRVVVQTPKECDRPT